ncbi:MAG: hypothetical protein QGH72_00145 [Dehalococcoidia bacterium]|nr:hypothetical protein [Dehalococcoidia bacterium]
MAQIKKALLILEIIRLHLGFIIIQSDDFPILGLEASHNPLPTTSTDEFSVELAEEVGDKFSSVYGRVITDLTSSS